MVQMLWKTVWWLLKKLKIELLYDPSIPWLDIGPEQLKSGSFRDACTPMSITALFTIAKRQKKAQCSWWHSGKEAACQCRRCRFYPWVRKIPWRREWEPTSVFLPRKSHGQRSLAGYSPGGCKKVGHDLVTKQQQQYVLSHVAIGPLKCD